MGLRGIPPGNYGISIIAKVQYGLDASRMPCDLGGKRFSDQPDLAFPHPPCGRGQDARLILGTLQGRAQDWAAPGLRLGWYSGPGQCFGTLVGVNLGLSGAVPGIWRPWLIS